MRGSRDTIERSFVRWELGAYLKTGVRHMLLVLSPRDGLLVQQVSDGGNISRGLVEVIIVHAKGITTNCREVVGLGRVSEGIELGPGVLVSGADRVDPVRC